MAALGLGSVHGILIAMFGLLYMVVVLRLSHPMACGNLVPQPRIEHVSLAGRQILDHWTNREVFILPSVLTDMEAFHPFFLISGMEGRWRSLLASGAQAVFPFEYSMGRFSGVLESWTHVFI